jgi:hypothetical protein
MAPQLPAVTVYSVSIHMYMYCILMETLIIFQCVFVILLYSYIYADFDEIICSYCAQCALGRDRLCLSNLLVLFYI